MGVLSTSMRAPISITKSGTIGRISRSIWTGPLARGTPGTQNIYMFAEDNSAAKNALVNKETWAP